MEYGELFIEFEADPQCPRKHQEVYWEMTMYFDGL